METLTSIVGDLEAAKLRWRTTLSANSVRIDPVSAQLFHNVREMNRRATEYVHVWTDQVRQTRDALQGQLDGYDATEQGSAERFG